MSVRGTKSIEKKAPILKSQGSPSPGWVGSKSFVVVLVAVAAVVLGSAIFFHRRNNTVETSTKPHSQRTSAYPTAESLGAPVGANQCQTLTIYRYGVLRNYSGSFYGPCEIPTKNIVEAANKLFPNHQMSITRLFSITGRDLPDVLNLKTLPLSVIALGAPHREHFVWPSFKAGHEADVELGAERKLVSIKTLAADPKIFEIENLLSNDECDNLYDLSLSERRHMEKSRVGVGLDPNGENTYQRQSRHTWIGSSPALRDRVLTTNDVVERVGARILDLTRLHAELSEPFQVVFYNISDYYYGHHDFFLPEALQQNPYIKATIGGGNRFVTILIYLNDVAEGGHTSFPFVDPQGKPIHRHVDFNFFKEGGNACNVNCLKVKPRKGGAVMFYNLLEKGHMEGAYDKWTIHAGCQPKTGPKYVTNKWIRNKLVNGLLFDERL